MLLTASGHGALPATGGARTPGTRMNGTSNFASMPLPGPDPREPISQCERPEKSAAWRLLPLFRRAPPKLVRSRSLRLKLYIELHARSAFSFLEGASTPEELAGHLRRTRHAAMALLDRDGVYGSPRFHLAAKKLPSQRAHRRGSHLSGRAGAIRCSSNRARDTRIFAA